MSKLNSALVDVSVSDTNQVFIQSGQVDFDILGTSTEEYPVFPEIEKGTAISLSVGELRNLIKYTIFSVSFDETKQFLNGILVQSEKDSLSFVATDGFRLAIKTAPIPKQASDFSVIVPFKAMNELFRIIQSEEEDTPVQITLSENQVSFSMSHFCLISRIIKGQFPDYRQVLPKESSSLFTIQRRFLLDASERASIIANESNNVVKYQFQDDVLTIQANAAKLGEFKEDVTVKRNEGEGQTRIAFNVRLVLDAIKTVEADDVTMAFNNELSPCVLKSGNSDDFTYIIMPIRTSDYNEGEVAAAPPPVVEPPVREPEPAAPVPEPEPIPEPVEPPEQEPVQTPGMN